MSSRLLLLCCIAATIHCVLSCPSSKKDTSVTSNAKSPNKAMELFVQTEATPIISSAFPNPELFLGCFFEPFLPNWALHNSDSLTHSKCASECVRQGSIHKIKYTVIGLRNSSDCFCGFGANLNFTHHFKDNNSPCTFRCSGNPRQPCGGQFFFAIYNLTAKMLEPDEYDVDKRGRRIVPVFPDKPEGCYQNVRDSTRFVLNKMTRRKCAAECLRIELYPVFNYFGIKNGDTCSCEQQIPQEAQKMDEIYCQTSRCAGNGNQPCGGPTGSTLFYKLSSKLTSAKTTEEKFVRIVPVLPAKPVGCYIMHEFKIQKSSDTHWITFKDMGHRKCAAECVRQRLKPAYTYYALIIDRCLCATKLPPNELIENQINCQTRCSGNETETCGSISHIMFYNLRTEESTTEPSDEKHLVGFAYANRPQDGPVGCYTSSQLSFDGVDLPEQKYKYKYRSLRACAQACVNRRLNPPYTYFAVIDDARVCSCGNKLPKSTSVTLDKINLECQRYKCEWGPTIPGIHAKPCGGFPKHPNEAAVYKFTITEGFQEAK